jgi:hypothetical protein
MTFFTAPVLREQPGLTIPLPQEIGFDWSWIRASQAQTQPDPLKAQAADAIAAYGYAPQSLEEGWLRLAPAARPPKPPAKP